VNLEWSTRWNALSRLVSGQRPGIRVVTQTGARELSAATLEAIAGEYDQIAEVYADQADAIRVSSEADRLRQHQLFGKALAFEQAARDLRLRAQMIREGKA
jgi:hypothetical protein